MVRLTIARSRQLSFLVDGKRSEQFDRKDGNVGCHVIAVNDVRHIIAAEELHSGQVSVKLSYFTVEPLPEVCSSPSNIFFVTFLSVVLD